MENQKETFDKNSMVFADAVKSISIIGSNARIQLETITESEIIDGKNVFKKEVISTIVMPLTGLDGLMNILEQLKKQIKEKKNTVSN
ncbi:MAG: hypothetical protein CMM49_02220 [Rhodospirillaceae bacterium]|nr:hypothetical protein [Rhodospirillaceae bacterium]|tara:strand:+ start:1727 stop:1987 length:261 start_codon:yes stop_codon:yes gene_type:complete